MNGLSVVVANRSASAAQVAPAAAALARELDRVRDEVIWVDRRGTASSFSWPAVKPAMKELTAHSRASRGECYGLGLAAASRPLVAFTDSHTLVEPGWRAAATAAIDAGAIVAGGPVLPGGCRSAAAWAGFFADYGHHAVAPYTSAAGDVSGNNVVYRRDALLTSGASLWKAEVNARLQEAGIRPVVAPGMRVTVGRGYRWSDLGLPRARSAALYATQRSARWPIRHRLLAAAACPALPTLCLWRLWLRIGSDRQLRTPLLRSLPAVAVAFIAWSGGEAAGYLWRAGGEIDVW